MSNESATQTGGRAVTPVEMPPATNIAHGTLRLILASKKELVVGKSNGNLEGCIGCAMIKHNDTVGAAVMAQRLKAREVRLPCHRPSDSF